MEALRKSQSRWVIVDGFYKKIVSGPVTYWQALGPLRSMRRGTGFPDQFDIIEKDKVPFDYKKRGLANPKPLFKGIARGADFLARSFFRTLYDLIPRSSERELRYGKTKGINLTPVLEAKRGRLAGIAND